MIHGERTHSLLEDETELSRQGKVQDRSPPGGDRQVRSVFRLLGHRESGGLGPGNSSCG